MSGDRGWEDVELPIPGLPPAKVRAKAGRNKTKDDEDADRLVYRRVHLARRSLCDECVTERDKVGWGGVEQSAYMRIAPSGVLYLCMRHTNAWREKDELTVLRGG